jgi:ArsR family transcriptional regulator, arsenate/arsenite/antimonite-responsive transcriptional repressor
MYPVVTFVKANMTRMRLNTLFQALADRTRLRLVNLLGEGEICVCYFVEILDEPQPKISRHLAYLRRAGLVETRRDGKWMHYRLAAPADPATARILDAAVAELKNDREMQRDLKALRSACCATRLPRSLADAPRPSIVV